jgi:ankyrin repeat protein
MVKLFLKHGLTSYDKNKFGQSPYDRAIFKNSYESVEIFNRLKNDKDYQSQLLKTPLILSIVMNEFDKADCLIPISNVDEKDSFGNTALFYAIMNRESYLVEKLLNKNASIYNIDRWNKNAIYFATIVGNIDIIKHLQKAKIDYTEKYDGYSVLEIARYNHDLEVYEVLKKGPL